MGRDNSESPVRRHVSPRKRSPSRRERSPSRHRSSRKENTSPIRKNSPKNIRYRSPIREKTSKQRKSVSPIKEKPSSRARSPKRVKSRSPSPRTKRLKRLQAEKMSDKEGEENHGRRNERKSEVSNERRERKSRRDERDDNEIRRSKRSISPSDHNRRSGRNRSRSPRADEVSNSRESDHPNGEEDSVAKMKAAEEALETKEKQKPSFELSGKLAEETNRVKGITLLFTEPPEARKPDIRWRLYVFKGGEELNEPLYIHRQSCYLFGRERRVADIPTDHPSCSKQHAVLQYRQVEVERPDGTLSKKVKPYLMDLGSTNCTAINDNKMEPHRYYELMEGDTIKFGNSSREYVLLHEKSAG